MPVRQNDFVELEYTGKLKEGNVVFDTTDAEVAKKHGLPPNAHYGPVVICLGQGQLLRGLEAALVGKEPGAHSVELSAEQAFGKKNAKLIQMVPARKFLENKIQPVPGLQLNIDGALCTVRQVTGGRVMVDFNHPLAGKDVVYEITISKIVTDRKEQLKALLVMFLDVKDAVIAVEGSTAKITLAQELPAQILPELRKKIRELTGVDAEIILPSPAKPGNTEQVRQDHRNAPVPHFAGDAGAQNNAAAGKKSPARKSASGPKTPSQ